MTTKPFHLIGRNVLLLAFVAGGLSGAPAAKADDASESAATGVAKNANGYIEGHSHSISAPILGIWMDHTWEYYSSWGKRAWKGDTVGGAVLADSHFISSEKKEQQCMARYGEGYGLTYLLEGVCHQATNRSIVALSTIKKVSQWNGVGGGGTSETMFGEWGCGDDACFTSNGATCK